MPRLKKAPFGQTVAAALLALATACVQTPPGSANGRTVSGDADVPPVDTASAYGSYLAASIAQDNHNYTAAAIYLDRALQKDPENVDLLRHTFLLRLSQGDMPAASDLAKRLVQRDNRAGLAAMLLTVEQVKAGDDAGAAASALRLPQDGILRFSQPMVVAWTKAGQRDLKGALAALDSLDRTRGFEPVKGFHAALIEDFDGDSAAALKLYAPLVNGTDRINYRTADMAGLFFELHGRPGDAKKIYERFIKDNPDSADLVEPALARIAAGRIPEPRIASVKDGLAETFFDLASILNQRETQDLALLHLRLALELRPNFPLAQLLLGEIAESEERTDEALAAYRAVDPASPFAWSARLRIAEVMDERGQTDEAVAMLRKMADERPNSPQALIELGDILRGRSRFPEAVEAYDRAGQRIPSFEQRHWGFLYSRGIALERSGQWPRAEADFKRALELQPDQPLVLNYLGYSWIEKREHLEVALKMIQRAVQLRPDDGFIVDSLGWAYFQLGDYGEATQYLERAIELLPQDPTINDHLGDAYWRSGRPEEARYQWQRALQFKPEPDLVKTIDAKLDKGLGAPPGAAARGG